MSQKRRRRRSKLTPEKQSELFTLIAGGNTNESAAALAGISSSTFYDWKARGEKAKSGKYREFYETIKRAEALAEAKRIEIIRNAMEGKGKFDQPNWTAAAWYLERRWPERWGRRKVEAEVNHSGEVTERHEYHETRIHIEKQLEDDPESQELLEKLWERQKAIKDTE